MKTKILTVAAISLLLAGCIRPLKPGMGGIRLPSGVTGIIQQSENPKTESTQDYEKVVEGDRVTETIRTKIGAAQPDYAREAAAKLKALRPVMWVGIFLFLAGIASAFWPPLRAIVGSMTTSAVAVIAGLGLMILPTVIVGYEPLILVLGVIAVFGWWFVHRHGELRGERNTLRDRSNFQ